MNKPLKLPPDTLFISDPHMNHTPSWVDTPPLWKSRGFTSIQEHDTWLRDQWHKMVAPTQTVCLLGDIVFSDPKGESFRQFANWPGRILTLTGNHFSGLKQIYREAAKTRGLADHEILYPLSMGNVTLMGESMMAYIQGQAIYMQHYATYIWPEIGDGGWHLMGHSHGRAKDLNPECMTFGKALDIGLDNAIKYTGTPFFTFSQVRDIMAKKPVITRDHH